jgi:hypothetical protein
MRTCNLPSFLMCIRFHMRNQSSACKGHIPMPTNLFDKRLDDDEYYTHEDDSEDSDTDDSEAFECIEKKHTIFGRGKR